METSLLPEEAEANHVLIKANDPSKTQPGNEGDKKFHSKKAKVNESKTNNFVTGKLSSLKSLSDNDKSKVVIELIDANNGFKEILPHAIAERNVSLLVKIIKNAYTPTEENGPLMSVLRNWSEVLSPLKYISHHDVNKDVGALIDVMSLKGPMYRLTLDSIWPNIYTTLKVMEPLYLKTIFKLQKIYATSNVTIEMLCLETKSVLQHIVKKVTSFRKFWNDFNFCDFLISKVAYLYNSSKVTKGLVTCVYNNEICLSWYLLLLELLLRFMYLFSFYRSVFAKSLKSKKHKLTSRNWFGFTMNEVTAEYFEDALRESVRIHARLSFTHIHTSDNRIPTAVPIYVDSFIFRKDR